MDTYRLSENSADAQAEYVRELQTYMRRIARENDELPVVAVDGIYGPETRNAVSIFQRIYGLPVTGVVDRATWDAIFNEYQRIAGAEGYQTEALPVRGFGEPNTVLRPGSSGAAVKILQIMINTLAEAYANIERLEESGVYDAQTASQISEIQRLAGLPVSGETDKNTWNAIAREFNAQ